MSLFSQVEKTIEREFRKWTEKLFGRAESDELLLAHRAILEQLEARIQPGLRGRPIFPYNHVLVRLASPDPERRALLQSALGGEHGRLEQDVCACLEAAGCEIPAGFAVEIAVAESDAKGFEIACEIRRPAPAPVVPETLAPPRLVVVRGKANAESFPLGERRVNIGRKAELTDSQQRVVRRNDVIFEEGADDFNATVSRGHAHIRLDRDSGGYRVCDDSSEYGTRIFRDGRSIEVPPGSPRGVALRPGDEIYLGRACLRFER